MLATTLTIIMTLTSNPGESMDSFVARVSPDAVAYTKEHNVEVCGAIGQATGGGYILQIEKGRKYSCKIHWVRGKFTGQTFHTHPDDGAESFAPADLHVPGYMAKGSTLQHQIGGVTRTVK